VARQKPEKQESFPVELQKRKDELEKGLRDISGSRYVPVKVDKTPTRFGDSRVVFAQAVRIKSGGFHLHIWEDFRDVESSPSLYAFRYFLSPQDDISGESPLFRYECHPDVDDQTPADTSGNEQENFRSHYGLQPHFHPDNTISHPIRHLHYPFHRSERVGVVFALFEWIKVDLIRRYYDSGRVQPFSP
jgi:hypothetical protein